MIWLIWIIDKIYDEHRKAYCAVCLNKLIFLEYRVKYDYFTLLFITVGKLIYVYFANTMLFPTGPLPPPLPPSIFLKKQLSSLFKI